MKKLLSIALLSSCFFASIASAEVFSADTFKPLLVMSASGSSYSAEMLANVGNGIVGTIGKEAAFEFIKDGISRNMSALEMIDLQIAIQRSRLVYGGSYPEAHTKLTRGFSVRLTV